MHVDACGMQVDAYVDVASGVVNAGNIVPAFTLWSFFLVFVIQNFNNQTHIHFFFFCFLYGTYGVLGLSFTPTSAATQSCAAAYEHGRDLNVTNVPPNMTNRLTWCFYSTSCSPLRYLVRSSDFIRPST